MFGARKVIGSLALALLVWSGRSSIAASDQPEKSNEPPHSKSKELEELNEILVTGEKPSRKVVELIPWLRRLVGQYSVEAKIDAPQVGSKKQEFASAMGSAYCAGFGPAPGVDCQVDIRWRGIPPAGKTMFGGPADFLQIAMAYGIEPDAPGIRFMLVDGTGSAEAGLGLLVGNKLTSREHCMDPRGNCERITRITAEPEGKIVRIEIDIEVDSGRVAGSTLVLHRDSKSPIEADFGLVK